LCHLNRELDRDTNYKTVANFIERKGKKEEEEAPQEKWWAPAVRKNAALKESSREKAHVHRV
jgi:hypothetical protein